MLGSHEPVHDRDRSRCRARERRALPRSASAWRARRPRLRGRAGDLRVRAGAARDKLEQAISPDRLDQPRRHPPPAAARHGPVPGRLLHLPRGRDHARAATGSAPSRPTPRCSTSCRSAGRASGRSCTATSCARSRLDEWIFHGVLDVDHLPAGHSTAEPMKAGSRYDVVVIGAGTAGLVAGTRLAQAGAQRLRARQGRRLDPSGAGDDRRRSATRPSPWRCRSRASPR